MTAAIAIGLQSRPFMSDAAAGVLTVVIVALTFVWLFIAVLDLLQRWRDRE